ncbi:hypothetical protein [Streptomyces sp. SAI-090]|uniref:hypothetical protein n=1 Tax=Streptomyces sp. SAI-090 TaxID=2940545 RepID=UPI0024738F21|nr:hypothetical protein [Streptomyces sp. SAI-090]MDH6522274.1 hypothetical protein [Streptomyces sp. SAI-090]
MNGIPFALEMLIAMGVIAGLTVFFAVLWLTERRPSANDPTARPPRSIRPSGVRRTRRSPARR